MRARGAARPSTPNTDAARPLTPQERLYANAVPLIAVRDSAARLAAVTAALLPCSARGIPRLPDQQRALVEQVERLKREWAFEIIGEDTDSRRNEVSAYDYYYGARR